MTTERLLYAGDKETMRDGRSKCRACGKRIGHYGAARYNHAVMHERRGEARIELNPRPLTAFWQFYLVDKKLGVAREGPR